MDEVLVGLDIGTTKVTAVIAEFRDGDRLEITGVGTSPSFGLRRGVVINIEATLKSVAAAVETAELMSGREVQGVWAAIAGGHIEGINSRGVVAVTGKGREITRADVDRVIEAAKAIVIPMDREVLHVIPQEFIVDDQEGVNNPLDMIGVRLESEVHIITGSVTQAQNLIKCVNRSGFKVNGLVLASLAAAKAVLSSDEKELGVLLIDLGGGTTDILVYLEGAPYFTGVLPIGGAQVTGDLSIILKTPFDTAEVIKKESGCCHLSMIEEGEEVILPGLGGRPPLAVSRREICAIVQPRMAEILRMVREKIEKKGYLGRINGGVVVTGGGALLPGTVELARDVFGKSARIGAPVHAGGLVDEFQSPAFSTAVGLVLHAAGNLQESDAEAPPRERLSSGFGSSLRRWLKNFFE